jgi:ABC-2 type transport system ATP-binding protein
MNNPLGEVSPAASQVALKLDGLVKTFNGKVAVDHVDLSIPAGSMYGLVGPNGAGKTTSLMMAVGLLRPDSGSARVFGADVWQDPLTAKRRIGLLPDGLAMPERLTGREFLTFLGLLRDLDEATVADRAQELLSVLDLLEAESTLISDYSTGMRKKIGLASALLHAPKLLVLDEPFEAVDPVSAVTVRTILERFVASGGSVVFSSHVMLLVEKLCSHVGVIVHGKVVAAGTVEQVSAGRGLEAQFVSLAGGRVDGQEGLSWLVS